MGLDSVFLVADLQGYDWVSGGPVDIDQAKAFVAEKGPDSVPIPLWFEKGSEVIEEVNVVG
jgi:hypothetical protein